MSMNNFHTRIRQALLLAVLGCLPALGPVFAQQNAPVAAQASAAALPTVPGTQYSDKGADTCLYCHDEDADTATHQTAAIFKTKHAQRGNPNSPFGKGGLQCEACHGPGYNHSVKDSKKIPTINSQKSSSFMPAAERNAACLTCHQGTTRNAWHAGAHGRADVACASCHKMHTGKDPVMAKSTESIVCLTCHKDQRADFMKASTHPVRQGRMACSDCHNAHGSSAVASLAKPTLNQTCYSCHADKRGPVLWEHAPVAEDCSSCHVAHGSPRAGLLAKAAPMLCQDCHSAAGHPSVARTAGALPANGGAGAIFVTAGSCMNCHTQVHGSNHPAGSKLMR
jgi:DmsE family decaheme c-type cytochrome